MRMYEENARLRRKKRSGGVEFGCGVAAPRQLKRRWLGSPMAQYDDRSGRHSHIHLSPPSRPWLHGCPTQRLRWPPARTWSPSPWRGHRLPCRRTLPRPLTSAVADALTDALSNALSNALTNAVAGRRTPPPWPVSTPSDGHAAGTASALALAGGDSAGARTVAASADAAPRWNVPSSADTAYGRQNALHDDRAHSPSCCWHLPSCGPASGLIARSADS